MTDGPTSSTAVPPTAPGLAPVDLRPLTTSELIDRGFSLYRAHFAGFLLLALLCQTAPLLGQLLLTALNLNPSQEELTNELMVSPASFFEKVGLILAIIIIGQLLVFAFEVVIAFYISDAYLGKIPSVKESLGKLKSCLGPSMWTCLLNRVMIALTLIFPIVAGTAIYFYSQVYLPEDFLPLICFAIGVGTLLVASAAPVLVVFMRLMLTVPALALENRSGWKAIRRSSELVRYDPGLGFLYWGEMRLSFLLLPLFIIELLILSLTALPMAVHQFGEVVRHGSAGSSFAATPDAVTIASQILMFLAGSLILPLYSIATTLFYYDIRIRREGFDLEYMSGQLGERK
jgi:membrane-anchored glycerophosphoryl diester phosphodiesterase (GDPDase)